MRGADIQPAGALRPAAAPEAGGHGRDDALGLRPPLPRNGGRALRPGLARLGGLVRASRRADPPARTVPRGGERASGAGGAHGGVVGADGGGEPACGPRFDQPVPPHGYAWWYVDALSDDGRHGIILIAFLGSVFSPYYAWTRRHGAGDPLHHCALNVALYGRGKRWALTERGRGSVRRDASHLAIGPSALSWDGDALTIDITEVSAPLPARIRGQVRVHPAALTGHTVLLDAEGRHRWSPIAPHARVEVALQRPALRWAGTGYFDSNAGCGPLEDAFMRWDWSRAPLRDGTAILYDVARCDGGTTAVALRVGRSGAVEPFDLPPPVPLPSTRWRVARDAGRRPGKRNEDAGGHALLRPLGAADAPARRVCRGDAREPRPRPLRGALGPGDAALPHPPRAALRVSRARPRACSPLPSPPATASATGAAERASAASGRGRDRSPGWCTA